MDPSQYTRSKRVIEWMLTGHSTMRDRYIRRSRGLTLTVMSLSLIGVLLALTNGDQQVSILGLYGKLQVFLGVLAALAFFFSLLDLVVDWRQRAWLHKDAADRLGKLNLLFRRARRTDSGWGVEGIELDSEYDRVMGALNPLPEKKVMSLKALHNRKRAQFTLADQHPGAPAWLIRGKVLRAAVRGTLPETTDDGMGETSAGPETPKA